MAREDAEGLPFEARIYPEVQAGAFSRRDCTVAFYCRVDALLEERMTLVNLGAGRGANILADRSAYRRKLQTFKGRVQKVIGLDVDPVVLENPDLDEAHIIEVGKPYPLDDKSADIIVSDHVLEHVENPDEFAAEIHRVLKPGGWFCARTPAKWGYIGIGARAVPNALHTRFLGSLQPHRKPEDIFPTFYRLNSFRALRRVFPHDKWRDCTYGFNGVPGYHANKVVLFKAVEAWCWLMPQALSAKYHVFLQKR
jgi:SAM-dependent methyltransferase